MSPVLDAAPRLSVLHGRPVIHIEVSTTVRAPTYVVSSVYADYMHWHDVFPTISAVRLIRVEGSRQILEIDHREGKVINTLTVLSPDCIELEEVKRRYDAKFMNRFDAVPAGTRFTVLGDVCLKGWAKLLTPVLGVYVRRQMERYQLQPVKVAAEARIED